MLEYVNQDQVCNDPIIVQAFIKEKCSNRRCRSFNWDYYKGDDGKYYLHPEKAEELYKGLNP